MISDTPGRGGRGVKKGQIFADVLYGWPLTFQLHGEMALHCSVRYQFYKHDLPGVPREEPRSPAKHDRTIFHCRCEIQIAYLPNSATLTKAETFPCLEAGLGF